MNPTRTILSGKKPLTKGCTVWFHLWHSGKTRTVRTDQWLPRVGGILWNIRIVLHSMLGGGGGALIRIYTHIKTHKTYTKKWLLLYINSNNYAVGEKKPIHSTQNYALSIKDTNIKTEGSDIDQRWWCHELQNTKKSTLLIWWPQMEMVHKGRKK